MRSPTAARGLRALSPGDALSSSAASAVCLCGRRARGGAGYRPPLPKLPRLREAGELYARLPAPAPAPLPPSLPPPLLRPPLPGSAGSSSVSRARPFSLLAPPPTRQAQVLSVLLPPASRSPTAPTALPAPAGALSLPPLRGAPRLLLTFAPLPNRTQLARSPPGSAYLKAGLPPRPLLLPGLRHSGNRNSEIKLRPKPAWVGVSPGLLRVALTCPPPPWPPAYHLSSRPPPPLGPPLLGTQVTLIPGSWPLLRTQTLRPTRVLRSALSSRLAARRGRRSAARPLGPVCAWCRKGTGRRGCRAFSHSISRSSQRIGQLQSRLGSPVRMRLPPHLQ